jgi:hypothetical protein
VLRGVVVLIQQGRVGLHVDLVLAGNEAKRLEPAVAAVGKPLIVAKHLMHGATCVVGARLVVGV